MVTMISRRPNLDFADVPFAWTKVAEFAADLNASSPIAAQTEPYLNTVMAKIRRDLPQGPLRDEIDMFIKQEATHYSIHNMFNAELYSRGYEAVRVVEMELRADFQRMLKERSQTFNAAYCAGFENIALFLCKFIFFRAQGYFEGAERRMSDLFLWHYAEEFEHRSVAHDAFAAVSGNYFRRIHGAAYSFFHLLKYKMKIKRLILEIDRAGMSAVQRKASLQRERKLNAALARYVFPRMLAVLVPYYNPARTEMPAIVRRTLDRFAAA